MAITRVVTHAEVVALPDRGVLTLEHGAELTPLAAERVAARGIEVRRVAAVTGDLAGKGSVDSIDQTARLVLQRLSERLGTGLSELPADLAGELSARIAQEVLQAAQDAPAQEVGLPPAADYCAAYLNAEKQHARRRAVLTATGKNQKGIVAHLTTLIAEHGGDILDISQTLVGGYFTMLLIVDIGDLTTTFDALKQALQTAASARGVQAILMHEDIVSSMHRV
jgi:ACT domain-containing protein